MDKNNRLDNVTWFVNPWFDIILLAGFPIGLLLTVLPITIFPVYFFTFAIYLETLVNFPHMFAGFISGYVVQEQWKKKPTLFIVMPVLFFIIPIILCIYGYYYQVIMIRVLWGVYHVFDQNRFILGVHKTLNNDSGIIDRIFDTPAIIAVTVFSAIWIFINKRVFNFQVIFAWIIIAAFLLRQIYLLIRRKSKSSIFKVPMISSFAAAFYFPLIVTQHIYSSIRAGITLHNFQYLAWNWLYYKKSVKSGVLKKTDDVVFLSRIGPFISIFLLIGLICVVHLWKLLQKPEGIFIFGILYTPFAFIHFFLDPYVWKASKDTMAKDAH